MSGVRDRVRVTVDQEALYRHLYAEEWSAVLALLHRHRAALAEDALLQQAAATFLDAFFETLAADGPEALANELETLFLLHTGGFYSLAAPRFGQVVAALVALHAGDPAAAVGYARHCPQHPRCAEVLAAHRAATAQPVAHEQEERVALARTTPAQPDATISLFKSQQERTFFLAVREVFATYLVYPNVALQTLIAFEPVRDALTRDERAYFFRATVDCVVFDQHDDYRPRYCFELDSPLHDTEDRRRRDAMKDRILACAGQPLYRVRTRDADVDSADFVRLLRRLIAPDSHTAE